MTPLDPFGIGKHNYICFILFIVCIFFQMNFYLQVFTEKFELLPFLLAKPAMALPETLSPTGQ